MAQDFAKLCESGAVVRENYYSITYRANFILGEGEPQNWDIQHIRVPFPEIKEERLKARFNITDKDLGDFYSRFFQELKSHLRVCRELENLHDEKRIDSSTAYYKMGSSIQDPTDGHLDVYLVYSPMDTLVNSSYLTDSSARLSGILSLGKRLLQIVKNYNGAGYSVGALDLDSIFLDTVNGKAFVKNSFFFAAEAHSDKSDQKEKAPLTPDLRLHMKQAETGGQDTVSFDNDVYAVCSVLWTLLSGKHYTEAPSLTVKPRYAGEELTACLENAIREGAGALRSLANQLRKELSLIESGEREDIEITFDTPPYAAAYAHIDDKYRADRREEEKSKNGGDGNKWKKAGIVIAAVCVAAGSLYLNFFHNNTVEEFPAPSEEPVIVVEATPTPVPDTHMVTSAEAGLYTCGDLIVDACGIPSSRFYLNGNGDIECDPSRIPTRYEDLQFTERVRDLRDTDFDAVLTTDRVEFTAEEVLSYGIRERDILLPPEWDMSLHLRSVDEIEIIPTAENMTKLCSVLGIGKDKLPEEIHLTWAADWYETAGDTSKQAELIGEYLREIYSMAEAEKDDEQLEKALQQFSLADIHITAKMGNSEWYEEYVGCDDNTYAKLILISRENECDKIKKRTTEVNGSTVTLYYDDDGNTYDSSQWAAQETLREQIGDAKKELDAYREMSEPVIMVPKEGIEEYVYIERFVFGNDPVNIQMKNTGRGKPENSPFMISVGIEPANATSQRAIVKIDRDEGLSVNYGYNADYIVGEHNTYEQLKEMTLDFSASNEGMIALAMTANRYGTYTISFSSEDGRTVNTLRVVIEDTELPETSPSPAPTPTPTPKPQTGSYSGGQQITVPSGGGNSAICTPEPVTEPVSKPSPAPEKESEDKFTVTPTNITIKVGETIDLSPSMSCTWYSSSPSIATIGGSQGRTVTGQGKGTCEITARAGDGQTVVICVAVNE